VPGVEVERAHDLLIPPGVPENQVARHGFGTAHGLAFRHLGMDHAPGDLQGGEDGGGPGFPEPPPLEGRGADADQAVEPAGLVQDLPGAGQRANLPAAVGEDHRQNLGIGESVAAGA
jgi:hypothetical protein